MGDRVQGNSGTLSVLTWGSPMKTVAFAVCMACLFAGCESEQPQQPVQASAPAPPAPAMDWAAIAASNDGSEIMAYKTMARHADAWHRGSQETVDFTYQAEGRAVHADGQEVRVTAQEWKGLSKPPAGPHPSVRWMPLP